MFALVDKDGCFCPVTQTTVLYTGESSARGNPQVLLTNKAWVETFAVGQSPAPSQ